MFVESCTLDTEMNQITWKADFQKATLFGIRGEGGNESKEREGQTYSVNRYKVKWHMTHQEGTPELGIFSHHISFKSF